ncbi:CpaE family protein [Maricaulaceae bacterium NA33B04]|nr:CpaE family protein [Maricaulaceae bacterium NA33B04]
MSQPADSFENAFDPEDEFEGFEESEAGSEDPFLDAEAIERRMLSEEVAPPPPASGDDFGDFGDDLADGGFEAAAPGERVDRPFGARLADANATDDALEVAESPAETDDFGDVSAVDMPEQPMGIQGEVAPLNDDELIDTRPVPRITIHAFCESPETGQLIHNAGSDRRMSKTHMTVELGGLAAAIERFHDASTPELLLVETGMRGPQLFAQLEELAMVCDPDTKVVIIGATNDITLYRELIRRGVSEYLVPPMTPLNVIKTVSDLFLDPEAPFVGKTMAFIGAKGGVGSSTVAHNVSWQMTDQLRSDAVLVDLDLSFGTAGLDFNQDPNQTIVEALSEPHRLDEALLDRLLVKCNDRLSLFSAPATLESDWDFSPDAFDEVVEKVRLQAPFIALDLPHAWSPWVRQQVLAADQVVVTVTPDLACLRNAKNLFDLVRAARPNDEPPKVVVNMVGCPKKPDIPLKDFSDALGASPILVLPFEPALFGRAANNGQMIAEVDPKSKAADDFAHLASVLTGRSPAETKRSKSLFGNLFSKG